VESIVAKRTNGQSQIDFGVRAQCGGHLEIVKAKLRRDFGYFLQQLTMS
jgi:hypothetical protein